MSRANRAISLAPDESLEHFHSQGWMRVRGAFPARDAAAMCDVIWEALGKSGARRDEPRTWPKEGAAHLQHLKSNSVFNAIGTQRTRAAISEALGGRSWEEPRDWGAFFLRFPTGGTWDLPTTTWHIDSDYAGPLDPPVSVWFHAMLGAVGPQEGGMCIVSGSHRLVHSWFKTHPPTPGMRGADFRKSLARHPYFRDLMAPGNPEERIERFHSQVEEIDGIPLQVLENTAAPGDVFVMHPLLLHAPPAAHLGRAPRFLLSKSIAPVTA